MCKLVLACRITLVFIRPPRVWGQGLPEQHLTSSNDDGVFMIRCRLGHVYNKMNPQLSCGIKIHSYVIPLVQNKNAQCCSVILHCCLLYSLRNILVCLCYKMFFFSHFSNQSEVVHHWSVNITDATTDSWCRRGLFRSTGSSNRLPTLKSITAQSPLFSEDWTSHRSFLFSLTDLREICLWAGEKFFQI